MDRKACGNCGKSDGCGCQTKSPYEQSVQAVWHDPTQYDALKHGPSFFPGMKLSAKQKAEVREVVLKYAQPDGPPTVGWSEARKLLGMLRAASFIHQTNHWQTNGQAFYGDHLLFERLYSESQKGIDELAERIVGSVGAEAVDAKGQAMLVQACVDRCFGQMTVNPAELSLIAESGVLTAIVMTQKALEGTGTLSPGTSNLLEGIYDTHEVFTYLLKQRIKEDPQPANYDFR
jgi:DNA-binding ferritin-like protein